MHALPRLAHVTGLDAPIGPWGRCPAGGGAGSAGDAGAGDVCASGQGRGSRVDHGGALAGRPVGRSARGAVGPCEVHVRQGRHQQDAGAGSASAGDVCAPGFAPRSFFAGFSPSLPQPWLLGHKSWGEDDADPSRGYDRGFRAADGDCPRAAPSRDSGRKRQGGGRRGCRLPMDCGTICVRHGKSSTAPSEYRERPRPTFYFFPSCVSPDSELGCVFCLGRVPSPEVARPSGS